MTTSRWRCLCQLPAKAGRAVSEASDCDIPTPDRLCKTVDTVPTLSGITSSSENNEGGVPYCLRYADYLWVGRIVHECGLSNLLPPDRPAKGSVCSRCGHGTLPPRARVVVAFDLISWQDILRLYDRHETPLRKLASICIGSHRLRRNYLDTLQLAEQDLCRVASRVCHDPQVASRDQDLPLAPSLAVQNRDPTSSQTVFPTERMRLHTVARWRHRRPFLWTVLFTQSA